MCFFCLSQKPTEVRSHLPEVTSGTLPCAGSSPGYTEARAPGPLSLLSLLSDPTWLCGAGSWRRHTPIRRTKQHGGPHPDLGPSHPLRVPSHFQLQGAGSGALRPGLSLPGTSGTLRERGTPTLDGLQLGPGSEDSRCLPGPPQDTAAQSRRLQGRPGARLLAKGASGVSGALLFVAGSPFRPTFRSCLCSDTWPSLHFPFAWMRVDVPEGATEVPPAQCREANKERPTSENHTWGDSSPSAPAQPGRAGGLGPTTRGHEEAGQPPRLLQNRTSGALNSECGAAADHLATADGQGGSRGLFCTRA